MTDENKIYKTNEENVAKHKRSLTDEQLDVIYVAKLNELKITNRHWSDSYVIAAAMTETFDILIDASYDALRLLIYDKTLDVYVDLEKDIDIKYCSRAIPVIGSSKSLDGLARDVIKHIKSQKIATGHNARAYREPPRNLIKLSDGIFDVKKDEYVDASEEDLYHFTSKLNMSRNNNIDPIDAEILKRVLKNDWAQNDEDLYQMLLNILRCVIEGDSKGVSFFNYGPGGNGKSTFNNMARSVVPDEYVVDLNVHDFDKQFHLYDITSSTRLVIGDDLAAGRIDGKRLAVFKQIVDRQIIKTEAKFQNAMTVKPNCVVLQNTNTLPNWAEANNAVKARVVIVPWPEFDFRSMLNKGLIDDIELDELIKTEHFRHSLFNFVMNNTSYFKRFPVPTHIKHSSDLQIDRTDNVKTFVEYLFEIGIAGVDEVIPTSVAFEQYVTFLKVENPSAKPMARRAFTSRFVEIMKDYGYRLAKNNTGGTKSSRITSLTHLAWNRASVKSTTNYEDLQELLSKNRSILHSAILVNDKLQIDKSKVDEIITKIDNNIEIDINDPSNIRILRYLIYDKNHLIAISRYKQEIDALL